MKILLVDDNGENREILRLIIEKQGNEVIEAEDGQDGFNTLVHRWRVAPSTATGC